MALGELNWRVILFEKVQAAENSVGLKLVIDQDILDELTVLTQKTLLDYGLALPNVAKLAGHVSFWIRKLKPISHAEDSPGKYFPINEMVGLHVGLALCARFGSGKFRMPSHRVLLDWITSLHVHSHSPHSSALAFEMLFDERH